jgi:hypothetical protein
MFFDTPFVLKDTQPLLKLGDRNSQSNPGIIEFNADTSGWHPTCFINKQRLTKGWWSGGSLLDPICFWKT